MTSAWPTLAQCLEVATLDEAIAHIERLTAAGTADPEMLPELVADLRDARAWLAQFVSLDAAVSVLLARRTTSCDTEN